MHCGKPWNLYILITSPLRTTYPKKLLHLEFQSNNFLLALTETNKQTFEMTGCKSERYRRCGKTHISWNVFNGYGIVEDLPSSALKLTMISDENETQFLVSLIFI